MNRTYISLATFILSTAFTAYGQASVEQKVKQLQGVWYQNAQKLSELGINITEKEKFIEKLQRDALLFVEKLTSNYTQQEKEACIEKICISAQDFIRNLLQAFRNNIDVKDFFVKELIDNMGDYGIHKEKLSMFDKVKFITLRLNIESTLLKILIKDYGECLQKMAECERELVSLDQPWISQE